MSFFNKKQIIYSLIFISLWPFLYLLTQSAVMGDFTATFANVAGLLGFILMLWQLILGNRFISRRLSLDYVALIKLHIFLGIYGLFFMITHPFLEMLAYGQNFTFLFLGDLNSELNQHIAIGRLAIYLYLFVWLSSALLRDKISYRVWRYLHYLSYPVLFLTFIHAAEIGTFLQTFPLIKIYFFLLVGALIALTMYRLSQFLDVGKFPYVLSGKKINDSLVTTYFFRPLSTALAPQIGQFFYIKSGIIAESHPFTVMSFDQKTGELVFSIKTVGQFTNQLEKIQIGQTVFIDGPYGVFTREGQNAKMKVIIAGGIGITPFVELIRRFGGSNTKLFYANKYLKNAFLRDQFKKQLGANYVDIVSQETDSQEPIVRGRISEQVVRQYLSAEFLDQANFFICGSPGFMAEVFAILKKLKIDKKRIFAEEFAL